MTRLDCIYQKVVHEFPESRRPDEELDDQIDEAMRGIECEDEEKEQICELMYTGSSYGQRAGFKQGFCFVVELLAEVLV